ncbi:MAG: hypothetical protein RL329_3931 [Bacteroidota bacterium]|jgi:hypothetical protein
MFDKSEGYSYLLKSKINVSEGDLQFKKHIYTFKSPKTNQTYRYLSAFKSIKTIMLCNF